jgi:hypothetical protein
MVIGRGGGFRKVRESGAAAAYCATHTYPPTPLLRSFSPSLLLSFSPSLLASPTTSSTHLLHPPPPPNSSTHLRHPTPPPTCATQLRPSHAPDTWTLPRGVECHPRQWDCPRIILFGNLGRGSRPSPCHPGDFIATRMTREAISRRHEIGFAISRCSCGGIFDRSLIDKLPAGIKTRSSSASLCASTLFAEFDLSVCSS